MPPIASREVSGAGERLPDPEHGDVRKHMAYHDAAGDHLLVLRRNSGTSSSDGGGVEHIVLAVDAYGVDDTGGDRQYLKRWRASETVECEGLDFEADFLGDALHAEDLDGDGHAEVLFGYSTFCGGGIEPHDITLILRAGEREYRLQGESLIQPPGDAPAFGGTYATTPAEADIPPRLRAALIEAWERVKHQSTE